MKKSGLADSPFFAPPEPKKPVTPPSPKVTVKKGEGDPPPKRTKRKTPVDQSTDRSTERPTDRPIDKSTDRPIDQLTDVEALGPVVARPSAFYITQSVDRWLDEAVRYLKEKGLHKADIGDTQPEVVEASTKGITLKKTSPESSLQRLYELASEHCGSHGKKSSLISSSSPSYVFGCY